jgi:flagellin
MERTAIKTEVTQSNQLQQGCCTIFKEEKIMSMVVQHNLTAMNANRQLGVTTSGQAKSAEKLSSGYRINRAGDDAAGLKISEKMRSQIRGLNKASDNAEDGVSLIQTAEGALNEAHSILQRMNELAVQGANDTNESIDRDAINQELSALTEELDRISSTTQFNKQNLLDGSFTSKNLQVGANTNQKITVSINAMNARAIGLSTFTYTVKTGSGKTIAAGSANKGYKVDGGSIYATSTAAKSAAVSIAKTGASAKITQIASTNGLNYYKAKVGTTAQTAKTYGSGSFAAALQSVKDTASYNATKEYSVTGNLGDHRVVSKWQANDGTTTTSTTGGVRVDNYEAANKSISMIQAAINNVSGQRSYLGALQNRLEHTIANLDNVSENTQSAESRIRDTDMASEMVEYSKNNILAQAGQSMLAQANQSTQGVLSLLG